MVWYYWLLIRQSILSQLLSEISDLSTCDQAIVSPSGKYMMYLYGGYVRTVNQPFATLEKPGWALMELSSKKIVYSEPEKEGTILNGVHFTQGLLAANSTTPFDKVHYDYNVFFNEKDNNIYRKYFLQTEWDELIRESNSTGNTDWMYFIKKFNFESILVK